MRINQNISFKGTFYTVADSHTRLPMTAGLLTRIEEKAKKEKEPVFLLDGGDFAGDTYSTLQPMCDIYLNFHKRNPQINCIFNLGNTELEECFINKNEAFDGVPDILKKFKANGINLVNATIFNVLSDTDEIKDYIKPYITVQDTVDGESKKILITGFTQRKINKQDDINTTKEILKETIKPATEKENPDEIILMMHTWPDYTKEILDYARQELNMKNIKFVAGGHPHTIEDFTNGETRVLYPAPNGKCAYEVKHTKNGFEFPLLRLLNNKYNYEPLKNNSSVILNTDTNNPLPINQTYQTILNKASDMNTIVAKSMFTFKTRSEYNFEYSSPSQLGTFMANSIKNETNSDIGIMLTQDFREKLPEKGKNITRYNVYDVVNVDKDVYQIKNVNIEDLKNIFEISLQKQNMGEQNPDFFEYSSNVKIDRKITTDDNQIYIKDNDKWVKLFDENGNPKIKNIEILRNENNKITQIYKNTEDERLELLDKNGIPKDLKNLKINHVTQISVEENGEWTELLDEEGNPKDPKKTFTIATCKFIANGGRPALEYFKTLTQKHPYGTLKTRETAINGLKELQNNAPSEYATSIMNDVL